MPAKRCASGLVDEVVPAAELMERAEALAGEIAAQAPLAIAETLRLVDEGLDLPLDLALLREADRFGYLAIPLTKPREPAPFWKSANQCGRASKPTVPLLH